MTEVDGDELSKSVDALRNQLRTAQGGGDPALRINLAIALAKQSNALADRRQPEDALAAIDEAVQIHRELARVAPMHSPRPSQRTDYPVESISSGGPKRRRIGCYH